MNSASEKVLYAVVCHMHRRIRLVEGNAKSLRLKSNLEKDFAAAEQLFIFLSPPSLLSF
jgi:hypothetical protein